MKSIYLDYNATFPTRPEILTGLLESNIPYGNPSSIHSFGRKARQKVENTRQKLAKHFNVLQDRVIFTSGGTEANNMVLRGFLSDKNAKKSLLISSTEHASVFTTASYLLGQDLSLLPVLESGIIDLSFLEDFLRKAEAPVLVSVMYANNETGVIQPISQIASLVHLYGGFLHCDAVQAFGKIHLDFQHDMPDFMTISGHKIGALQGVGALICRDVFSFDALIAGGGQEKGRRSGTENVLGIESLGLALDYLHDDISKEGHVRQLRDYLENELRKIDPELLIFGEGQERLPNTSAFASKGLLSETQVIGLDLEGFAISSGSACSSGKTKRSHVICAMGTQEEWANSAIRVSLGPDTKRDEIDAFVKAWTRLYMLKDHSKANDGV